MTASQSQRKTYNPGVTVDQDGGYGEAPGEGPHHNRGDLERQNEPGFRETHAPDDGAGHANAVSFDNTQDPKNIKSQETLEHRAQQRVGEDQQVQAFVEPTPPDAVRAAAGTDVHDDMPVDRVDHTDSAADLSPDRFRTDADILAEVTERLMRTESLDISDVRIAVVSANVTLEGFVPHRFMQHVIEDVVDHCAGVREIDNRIHVRHRPGEDEPTLSIGN
ncbi:BON domain-containing protein [Pararobbsia silviterrae]|uniref:BON domain-containing protein n=1 Tax=Pararobbsia silviterrae TaxID=1792498 RepID=A0A494YBR8_9BURK|nr:BON domain-containing protein [Pararobbsia silviterrae]RKP59210.1 BON domain-containing protein [Pararobbsia silviterrae]